MAKTALISGGARGIGRCIARRFLERGYKVYILDIDEEELSHTVNVHLRGEAVDSSICNLCDVNDIRKAAERAAKFLDGHIDVLVNNGGVASPRWKDGKTMEDMETLDEWQAYIETNLTAPFVLSQACIPYMKDAESITKTHTDNETQAGPCIILVGSFRALMSDANQEGYASSKAGLLGLLHSMARSLQPLGIRVNLVAPGRIHGSHESKEGDSRGMTWVEQSNEKDVGDHSTNRAGRPKDVADAVEYLVGAGFVTAEDITVDGGATKKK